MCEIITKCAQYSHSQKKSVTNKQWFKTANSYNSLFVF